MRLTKSYAVAILLYLAAGPAFADEIVTSVLPSSRATAVGTSVTVFETVINASGRDLINCQIQDLFDNQNTVFINYKLTDPATNAVTSGFNPNFSLTAGSSQSLILILTPSGLMDGIQISPVTTCTDPVTGDTASRSTDGLNTILLSVSSEPTADVIALAATPNNDGIVHIQGNGSSAFAVAVANVGIGDTITASVDTGELPLPLTASICQTDSAGQCMKPPALTTDLTLPANGTASFGIFIYANGELPLDPAHARIFVRFHDSNGKVRGATSVAVTNQPTLSAALPKGGIFLASSKSEGGYPSGTAVLFVGEDGELQGFDDQANVLSGNLALGQNLALTGTSLTQQPSGTSFAIYDWAGTIAQHSWFEAALVERISTGYDGPRLIDFSATYQVDPYERGSALSKIQGAWNIRDSSGSLIGTASFTNSGAYTGTVSGCGFKGQVNLIDAHYDLYRMSLNFQGCHPTNLLQSSLAGLAAIVDDQSRNDTLFFIGNNATIGQGFAATFVRY